MLEQVGRYQIKGQIGKGAMGVVYLADDPLLNRQAAIKTVDLSVEDASERDFLRQRLLRDARAAAALTHPNIVSVYDVLEEGNSAYLVMEFISGDTLAARLSSAPVPDLAFTMQVLQGMAAALDYTHARGIVHRDIKPANVMIESSGAPKIMDFGIARIADSRTNTPPGMVMGTIEYMSPEQVKGETVDGRSDQFALAGVAYRMLTGGTLFGQHSLATLAYKIVNESPAAVRSRNSTLPSGVDAVLSKALAKAPQDRYATCSEFVAGLASALAGTDMAAIMPAIPIVAPTPSSPTSVTAPLTAVTAPMTVALAPEAKPSRLGIYAGIAALVVAGGGLAAWQPWKSTAATSSTEQPAAKIEVPEKEVAKAAPPTPAEPPKNRKPDPPASNVVKVDSVPTKAPEHVKAPEPVKPPDLKADTAGDVGSDAGSGVAADADSSGPIPPNTPKAAWDAYQKGKQFAARKQLNLAVAAFTEALSLKPDWPSALFDRARAYQLTNRCHPAISDFSRFIEQRPQNTNALAYRGICYARLNLDVKAFNDVNAALDKAPKLPIALYGRSLVRSHRNAWKKALEDLDAAIASAPRYALAYEQRSVVKHQLGDEAGSKADADRASALKAEFAKGG